MRARVTHGGWYIFFRWYKCRAAEVYMVMLNPYVYNTKNNIYLIQTYMYMNVCVCVCSRSREFIGKIQYVYICIAVRERARLLMKNDSSHRAAAAML